MRTGDAGATNSSANNLTLMFGITNASGAGTFQLGDTDRKATLKLGATNTDFVVANNSANTMTFQQQVGISSSGSNNRTLVVAGTGIGSIIFDAGLENGGTNAAALALRVNNTGAVQLGSSTYTGGTILNSGTIALASGSALGTGPLTINGGAIGSVTSARTITNNIIVGGNFGLGVTNAGFSGQTTTLNGDVDLGGQDRTVTMLANSATIGGVVSGNGGLIVESSSTTRSLTLTNNNTYKGQTRVNGGTLIINGSTAAESAVTIASGATLKGSGTINGATIINGIHSPGNSPGLQTFASSLTYNNGASLIWELAASTADPALRGSSLGFDGINVGGNLDFAGPVALNLSFNFAGSSVLWSQTLWTSNQTWQIYSVTGKTSNFNNFQISTIDWADSAGNLFNTALAGSSFRLEQTGQDVFLKFNAIPEPSTPALLGIGLAALAGLRASRRRKV